VQELSQQNDSLKAAVDNLTKQNADMLARLEKLEALIKAPASAK